MNRQDFDNAMAARDNARDYLAALHASHMGCLTKAVLDRYEEMKQALRPIFNAFEKAWVETLDGVIFEGETIENEFY